MSAATLVVVVKGFGAGLPTQCVCVVLSVTHVASNSFQLCVCLFAVWSLFVSVSINPPPPSQLNQR